MKALITEIAFVGFSGFLHLARPHYTPVCSQALVSHLLSAGFKCFAFLPPVIGSTFSTWFDSLHQPCPAILTGSALVSHQELHVAGLKDKCLCFQWESECLWKVFCSLVFLNQNLSQCSETWVSVVFKLILHWWLWLFPQL